MRRHVLHPMLAALAFLYLAAMVVSGAMPVQRQLVRFEAKGVLKRAPEEVTRVELSRGTRRVTLLRAGETAFMTAVIVTGTISHVGDQRTAGSSCCRGTGRKT